jgi:DNA polymerase-3 subunit gamma/tau
MSYVVTARKWRPMVFEDVVGQTHVSTTLKNAIGTNRLSHAYIFSGPRGVGKTTMARILAKAINCLHPKDVNPDNECDLCKEITEGRSLNVFEIDGASNRGIDEIRNLRDAVRYGPAKGKYKVYIIDEVHMLTKEAFNALLKTLEEPPPHILFIFATTEVHKVPATILSRCQRFDFRRNTIEEIVSRLTYIAKEEKIKVTEGAALLIAKKADGSMRDAQSIFDQIVAFCGDSIDEKQIMEVLNIVDQELYFRTTDIIKAKDSKACLALVDEIMASGYDLREFLQGLNEHFRNLLIVQATGSTKLVETSEPYKKRYTEEAKTFSENRLLRFIHVVSETEAALKYSQQPRYKLEIGLFLLMKVEDALEIGELLARIDQLKKKIESGAGSGSGSSSQSGLFGNTSTRTDVRGSVKASPPTLQPGQVVTPSLREIQSTFYKRSSTPSISLATEINPGKGDDQSPLAGTTPVASLTFDDIGARWQAFIDEARSQKMMIGTMLEESKPTAIASNTVKLACPNDYHLDTLKRNKEFLLSVAQKVFGAKIRFEGFVGTADEQLSGNSPAPGSAPKENDILKHPVVQALEREFGARTVD